MSVVVLAALLGGWLTAGLLGGVLAGVTGSLWRAGDELVLAQDGIRWGQATIPWSDVAGVERGRVGLIRQDVLVLRRPFEHSKLPLETYERDWRRGRIGEDLRRWAPHVLG